MLICLEGRSFQSEETTNTSSKTSRTQTDVIQDRATTSAFSRKQDASKTPSAWMGNIHAKESRTRIYFIYKLP